MKRWILVGMSLALGAGLVLSTFVHDGRAQVGGQQPMPGNPFLQGSSQTPADPFTLQSGFPLRSAKDGPAPSGMTAAQNADIAVKPADGEWLICLIVYKGPEAHQWARQLVSVLRNPPYKLWAFVHDNSPEARKQQEILRQERIEKYKQAILATGQPLPKEIKIKMPKIEIQDEVAVLVGGYKDPETARKAKESIKKLPMPDPKLVQMDRVYAADEKFLKEHKKPEEVFVNPLVRGFVVRNPSMPKQDAKSQEWDMAALRNLNSDESYSLLQCKKKITLVVKEFPLGVMVIPADTPDNVMSSKIFGKGHEDYALHNAHMLAKMLREQAKLEAYVLHDRKYSLVTVGGFDSPNDPGVQDAQARIANLHRTFAEKAQTDPNYNPLVIKAAGIPFAIPH